MKELNLSNTSFQDIKTKNISEKELDYVAEVAGSYESLFSKRAMKYKQLGLANKNLSEKEYKDLILDEYTFLKRPVLIHKNGVAFGNSKKSVEAMKTILGE